MTTGVYFYLSYTTVTPQNVLALKRGRCVNMCDLQWAEDSLDNFFDISRRGSTIGTELRAGLTSFLTLRSGPRSSVTV